LRKKREEDAKKREAVLRKQQEMMQDDSKAGKPNYVIQKRSGGEGRNENQDGENGTIFRLSPPNVFFFSFSSLVCL
jgi:hypothetical protein